MEKDKLSFEDAMLFEEIKKSPEFDEIMKLIENSEELTESGVVAALAAKLGIDAMAVGSTSVITGTTSGAVAAKAGALVGAGFGSVTSGGGVTAGVMLSAPFALLLASLGGAWITYLIGKKLFQVMFIAKVKKCLGDKIATDTKSLVQTVSKLPKGNKQHDDAVAKLDGIKGKLLEKCGKK